MKVTEDRRRLEPVTADPFISGLANDGSKPGGVAPRRAADSSRTASASERRGQTRPPRGRTS